jgi:hypothetical protein
MRMKLFYASGAQQIHDLENDVNGWLRRIPKSDDIAAVNTASTVNGDIPSVTITVWFEDSLKKPRRTSRQMRSD